jgi:hypothetical protein
MRMIADTNVLLRFVLGNDPEPGELQVMHFCITMRRKN